MRPKTLYAGFGKARTACGMAHIHFHDLRHFSLTMAATSGATTKELMRRGGQSSPAAALRYQHATEEREQGHRRGPRGDGGGDRDPHFQG